MVQVDQDGIALLSQTGVELYSAGWMRILMWRADSSAVIIVETGSNKQLQIFTEAGNDIVGAMTAKATAVREAMGSEKVRVKARLMPKLDVEFRKNLISFEASKISANEAWAGRQGIIARLFGSGDLGQSIQTRKQLSAIFSAADDTGTGTLSITQLGLLLKSLNIVDPETGSELTDAALEEVMLDMDVFDDEVTFENFVAWALSSSTGAGASELLRRRVDHRKKEVESISAIFDTIDSDGDGMMDKHDFKELASNVGLVLNELEMYSAWNSLDAKKEGMVDFDTFFGWLKRDADDNVINVIRRAIRLTRLLSSAKGAMIYAVDKGNRTGKKQLRNLFDAVDADGSEALGLRELEQLCEDLLVQATRADIFDAMREMDTTGTGEVTFSEICKWWCGVPSPTKSGVLRSKLKLAAFTAKANGPILAAAETSDEGAGAAESYLNDLLAAAFAQKTTLTGRSLGVFGPRNHFRISCQNIVQNPVTDRVLVILIFSNVVLMALQSPSMRDEMKGLTYLNFFLMMLFTVEMGMRIVVNGLFFGEEAYLKNPWDIFDFVIINAVWVLYAAMLAFEIPDGIGYSLAMLRSFRALRFFAHVRNILNALIDGRVMTGAVLLLLFFMFAMLYVVGYPLYHGVMSTACVDLADVASLNTTNTTCPFCTEQLDCPGTYECASDVCYQLRPNWDYPKRERHIDKYGFDSFGASLLTVAIVVTLDDWTDVVAVFETAPGVYAAGATWGVFAVAVVFIGLFSVNLFVAGLAYSFIKVRTQSRNLEAPDDMKANLVEKLLSEGSAKGGSAPRERHLLQSCNPGATTRARLWLGKEWFSSGIMLVVLLNLFLMAIDHHDKSPETARIFFAAEVVFSVCYYFEFFVKIQGLGFKQYFVIVLNRVDFLIVLSSTMEYFLMLVHSASSGNGTAALRMLRLLKFMRAARVAKLIFRSEEVKKLMTKAFAGLDAIFSLIGFIFFMLTVSAIAGMNMLHDCVDDEKIIQAERYVPHYKDFGHSLLQTFQVMTGDGWTTMMFDSMECVGNIAAVYFVFITT